ncbi:L,D-transpeptidase [Phenylobacterium sp.]|uniref:L,D-transpeptidase family protein n=1 Tax=Phenylobacterium sp. TaxID=1871053 RepID=UPI0025F93E66|nr:L,D-transpeptidase [Phenylobacterium sp.]
MPAEAPPVLAIPPAPSAAPVARAVDRAVFDAAAPTPQARRDMLIRAQVLLDRAHFSPGVIDGQDGENVKNAIAAYERANGLPEDGVLDADVWAKLTADTGPILVDYAITPADAAGPYTPSIPKDYARMAKLDRLGFSGPLEALAERFHMDPALLQALNPGADFGAAGTKIVVAYPAREALPAKVATIEVDKARKQVRAYDAAHKLLAAYPATVGSGDLPTPSGEWAVRTIAPAPTWTYDPSRLNFGDRTAGKLTIQAGPNNPVGAVWIDLTKDTYGIHGAPEPRLVGKTASHGCVRLTNWDAVQLSKAVEKGTRVVFLGESAAITT